MKRKLLVSMVPYFPRARELILPLKEIEYGVYGDLILMYPTPYSIYLRGTIGS